MGTDLPGQLVRAGGQRSLGERAVKRRCDFRDWLFAAVTVSALLFGGARLAFSAPDAETVRVAARAPDRHLSELAYYAPDLEGVSPAERASKRDEHFAPVLDELFSRSEQEAIGGAKIIAWSEAAARTMEEDQANVVARAADLARKHGVYLSLDDHATGRERLCRRPREREPRRPPRPERCSRGDYQKSKPTPGDGHDPGPGIIPTVDMPYGRLATIICQDDFFPELVRQAGAAQVDILLLPSSDWDSVADWHAQQAPFRAIENGASVVRPTRQGTSLATDSQGRLLGYKPDYFVAEEQTLVASVPVEGVSTWYSVGGDAFAWACTGGLLVLIAAGLRPRRHRDR
jgi:apolipoprotein N-acyltransferase